MWKIGIWAENIMSAAILVLQWQGENFFKVQEFEISRFQTVHGVIKMLCHQRCSIDFQKLCFC